MLSKCYLLLITLSALLIASKTGVVNAGSKLSKDISQHAPVHANLNTVTQVIAPNTVQNLENPIKKTDLDFPTSPHHFFMYERIEYTKEVYRYPLSVERRILPKQSSDTYQTLTPMYGREAQLISSTKNNMLILTEKVNELNHEDRQIFAVKVFAKLSRTYSKWEDYEVRILKEFVIGSQLRHKNIVRVYDLIKNEKRQWCLVMEYLEGRTLYAYQEKYPKRARKMAPLLFKQLMRTVQYIHSKKIAHGDINPGNLILTPKNVLKIIDFGQSREGVDDSGFSIYDGLGAEQFRAPETNIVFSFPPDVPRMNPYKHNIYAADIFSCGVTYYYLFTGTYPWFRADESDDEFMKYKLDPKKWFEDRENRFLNPIKLPTIVKQMLNPNVDGRAKIYEIMHDEWFDSIPEAHD